MAINDGYNFIKDAFIDMHWLGTEWLIPLSVIFVIIILLTRDTEEWKILAFPVTVVYCH